MRGAPTAKMANKIFKDSLLHVPIILVYLGQTSKRKGNEMSPDGTYNGYANYQTWNVCLWISNDEGLNSFARDCSTYDEFKSRLRECLAGVLNHSWNYSNAISFETPDGVSWNDSSVNLAEMAEYWEENFSKVGS